MAASQILPPVPQAPVQLLLAANLPDRQVTELAKVPLTHVAVLAVVQAPQVLELIPNPTLHTVATVAEVQVIVLVFSQAVQRFGVPEV